jgi:hypothetical protein
MKKILYKIGTYAMIQYVIIESNAKVIILVVGGRIEAY